MPLYEKIKNGEKMLSLIGLGYVGMPIAGLTFKEDCTEYRYWRF